MPAYVIVEGIVTDPEQYEKYKAAAGSLVVAAGGRYLVRGGETTVLEGSGPDGRRVVLEFPSVQAALDWYHSAEYQAARLLREGAASLNLYVIEGAAP